MACLRRTLGGRSGRPLTHRCYTTPRDTAACGRILTEIEEAEQAAVAGQTEPKGLRRMNLPVSFGLLHVAPLLAELSTRYPQVTLDVGFNDRLVDLIEEGWDLAVRVGTLQDSTLVARRLALCRTVVCTAPAYVAAHGTPLSVADLAAHNCLGYTLSDRFGADRWSFGRDGTVSASISGTVRASNGDALRLAALAGLSVI